MMVRAALFAASGRAPAERIEAGLARARQLGWVPGELPRSAVAAPGQYLAGDDNERVMSLRQALDADAAVAWAVRGGYGVTRLDLDGLPLTHKPVIGFSDVTALLAAVFQAGGRALHGPVVTSLAQADDASVSALMDAVRAAPRTWRLTPQEGAFSGPLIGGNLEVLTRLIGTPNQVSFAGRVVVLEEVGEPWYRSDRALTHLLNATDLARACAVVWGEFVDCEEGSVTRHQRRLQALGIPCWTGAPVGHGIRNHAFIWGESVRCQGGHMELSGVMA